MGKLFPTCVRAISPGALPNLHVEDPQRALHKKFIYKMEVRMPAANYSKHPTRAYLEPTVT
jgi:hypothetical protein